MFHLDFFAGTFISTAMDFKSFLPTTMQFSALSALFELRVQSPEKSVPYVDLSPYKYPWDWENNFWLCIYSASDLVTICKS